LLRRVNHFLRGLFVSFKSEGSFVQNFSFVASGKLLVAISAFVFVPILARLFPPEAYGHFSLYNSIVTIATLIALMGYPSAYVLITDDEDFYYLMAFQAMTILCVFFLSLIILLFALVSEIIVSPSFSVLIILGFLVNGLMVILSNWNVRSGLFKLSSQLEGFGGIAIRVINAMVGWIGNGYSFGLIIGELTGRSGANIINLFRLFRSNTFNLNMAFNWPRVREVLIEWKNYPKFILPNSLLGQFSGHLPVYLLAFQFNKELLGYYGMAFTVFSLPIQLLSNAVTPVFLRKTKELYDQSFEALNSFIKRFLRIINLLLIFPFTVLIVFSEEIIVLFLGEQWFETGFIVSLMAFPIFIELTLTPLTSVLQVLRKENKLLALNLMNFILMTSTAACVVLMKLEFNETIFLLVGVRLVIDLIKTYLVYNEVRISVLRYAILYLSIVALLSYGLNYVKLFI
jgi:O-antigen/teichoic acid export membrane protein